MPFVLYDEAVQDALRFRNQADRLMSVLKRERRERDAETLKLQTDIAFLEKVNADLAFALAARDYELARIKGEC